MNLFLKKRYLITYRIAVVGMFMFGSVRSAGLVWSIADTFMGLMALVDMYAIFRLSTVAKTLLDDYILQKKDGKDPEFLKDDVDLPGKEHIEAWEAKKEEIS